MMKFNTVADDAPTCIVVKAWASKFKHDPNSVVDERRSGRRNDVVTVDNIQIANDVLNKDRRLTIIIDGYQCQHSKSKCIGKLGHQEGVSMLNAPNVNPVKRSGIRWLHFEVFTAPKSSLAYIFNF